ncbi:MAG: UDP-glucose 4-epimerase GalE [Chitinophagaceae bacterium]|nr:UDP-glucose 4-epimerase GalE [Chitinophagaceae bacterium]MCW5928033.1 UDP-glucose 4-epimerase GalE [Chitinophagaceae bacterium]
MKKILVTGGCGYIGSHTIADLTENGFDVISVDNNSRSTTHLLEGIEKITGKKVKNYKVDLCDFDDTNAVFEENPDIVGVIHFAAYKAVGESVEKPLLYFENNLVSLINLLKCVASFKVPYFVFSSSCTVYGNPDSIPVTEETPTKQAESPYGYTKQMGEQIITEFAKASGVRSVLLRYFNPAGAHPSALMGEMPLDKPQNLVPVITQSAIGKLPGITVFGDRYPTRDGSCVRDFIHVCDLAHAHTLALQYMIDGKLSGITDIFNLGTGSGITVLEAIRTFEAATGIPANYKIGSNRPGDVIAIYANNDKARRELGWEPKFTLEEIMKTAWAWEQKLQNDEKLFTGKNIRLN